MDVEWENEKTQRRKCRENSQTLFFSCGWAPGLCRAAQRDRHTAPEVILYNRRWSFIMQSGGKTWFILPFQSVSGCFQRRVFAAVSPVTVCCGGTPHSLNVCLRLFSSVFSDPGCERTSTEGCVGNSNHILFLKARNCQDGVQDHL